MPRVIEGQAPFQDGFTWYRLVEPDTPSSALPLVVLHGGPGMASNYLHNLAELADETGRAVVLYDQFGCGRSTHRPEAPTDFWGVQLFVDEHHSLMRHLGIERYHLLGQSWGGMLAAELAVRGLRPASLAICNSPASMELWLKGAADLRAQLPKENREALDKHEKAGTHEDPEYLAATHEFCEIAAWCIAYRLADAALHPDIRHVVRQDPFPQDFQDSEAQCAADPTVYRTLNGPNEFHVVGTFKDWTITERLAQIKDVPTLVAAGEHDEATPITWQPFVDGIAGATSHVFEGCSHCCHLEQPEEFRRVIGAFLQQHDA
jgi:L-proline amide hydrolase